VTRWSTWQPFEPGMSYEIDLETPVTLNLLVAEGEHEQPDIRVRLETWNGTMWSGVGVDPIVSSTSVDPSWRRAAIGVLRTNGLKWLLVARSDWGAEDLHNNAELWGIQPKAATPLYTLFSLE